MKRTGIKNKQMLKLKQRLVLVRDTVRELTPTQLEQVNGGSCIFPYTRPWSEDCPTG